MQKEIHLKQVTPHCGVEVQGIDLSQPLQQDVVDTLSNTLANHCVLFFRNQKLDAVQQKELGRNFGKLHIHPAYPRVIKDHPEVMEIYADENSKNIAGEMWHSDVSCDEEPPLGTILYMIETPPMGGDTLFSSMYAAFDKLSEKMQNMLRGMTAIHDGEEYFRGRYEGVKEEGKVYPCTEHPVVRTHPVSGRPLLFVNRMFTKRIVQLTKHESDGLLRMLFDHLEHPEFQCRFHWKPGSVAFWDNRCAQHHAMWDYYPNRRRGLRVTIKGDKPFYQP